LGGKKSITAVVDEFVARVAADSRINGFFQQTAADPARLASFKAKLVDQICQASGGPCQYAGKDMKTAHAGMGITEADFNALVRI
jgi:hemoglobin